MTKHVIFQFSVKFTGDNLSFFNGSTVDVEGIVVADIIKAGLVTAIILSPLAATT